ncbi:MAG: flagellar hook-associated protein FlgK [Mariprofundaceae bacterium]
MILRTLHIASRSLLAQQKAIDVVSQNVANVNTPGYSRQSPKLASDAPDKIGGHNFGNGVSLSNISRSADHLLQLAQIRSGSLTAFSQTLHKGLANVEAVFGNLDSPGLTNTIDAFFSAQQQLANSPQDPIARLDLRSRANDLTITISGMQERILQRQQSADLEIEPVLNQINSLLSHIAQLNKNIMRSESSNKLAGGANDLRDQRDIAILQLAKLIPVQQVTTNNGGLLLQTAGGDLLVGGDVARSLTTGVIAGSSFKSVIFADNGQPASGFEDGGQLGALMSLRDSKLAGYNQLLDSLAKNLIFSVNQLHSGGTGSISVTKYVSELASGNPAAAVNSDVNIPFASNIIDGKFTVHVLDANPPTNPGGIDINIIAGTTSLNQIAADISAIPGVTATVDALGHLTIDGGANRIVFGNDTSNFLAAYEINTFFHGGNASNISVSAAIQNDVSLISTAAADNTTSSVAQSDNSIALEILALRDQAVSVDGTTPSNLVERGALLASTYGLDIAASKQRLSFREAEALSISNQQKAVSGVNLDEELVNMMVFQRAYEASAKVIQSSNEMLSSLMALIR